MNNLLFVHIDKTAGWSVIEALEFNPRFYTTNHSPITHAPSYQDYISFTIVRDPFTRVFSQYEWYTKKRQKLKGYTFEEFVLQYDTLGEKHPNMRTYLKPQYDFISDGGKVVVNEILRFERLEDDWNVFTSKYGLEEKLPHTHKNPYKGEYSYNLYTPKMVDKMNEVFKNDFTL